VSGGYPFQIFSDEFKGKRVLVAPHAFEREGIWRGTYTRRIEPEILRLAP
jgi:hypothetical protein